MADIDIDIDRAETTAETSAETSENLRREHANANADVSRRIDEPTLERRVDALERALARLAATATTLLTEKKDVDARLERVEARAKELEARMKGADASSPLAEPNRKDRRADVAPRGADGERHVSEHLDVVEIDRDSVAAIERAVEEATRAAMRSADARRVVDCLLYTSPSPRD